MAQKVFVNKTGYDLSVLLTVRRGDDPGNDMAPVDFTLGRGGSQAISYGDSIDPYLDGIAVNAVDKGNIIASQEFVVTRGSPVDNGLNTHDHVYFGMSGNSFVLSFSNG